MFGGCVLDKKSVFHILDELKSNEVMDSEANMFISMDLELRTDPDIMELLSITPDTDFHDNNINGAVVIKEIPNVAGGVWKVRFTWGVKDKERGYNLETLINGNELLTQEGKLTHFKANLISLKYARYMFNYNTSLTSFDSPLDALIDGTWMFGLCSNLTSFKSSLTSLQNGWNMLSHAKLDKESVLSIMNNLKTKNTLSRNAYFGIGIDWRLRRDEDIIKALNLSDDGASGQIKSSTGSTWLLKVNWN